MTSPNDAGVSTLARSDSLVTMKYSLIATKDSSMIHDDVILNVVVPSTESGFLPLTPLVSSCVDTTFSPPTSGDLVSAMVVSLTSRLLLRVLAQLLLVVSLCPQ